MQNLKNDLRDLDELDLMLVRELGKDARISYRELASKLRASHSTVIRRAKRLLDQGIIKIVTILAYDALGYETFVIYAIKAPPGMVDTLAKQLASANSIKRILVTSGSYDVLAMALYKNPDEYMKLFPEEIGDIPTNARIETMLSFKLVKSSWYHPTNNVAIASHLRFKPTELDLSVIRGLEKSPRASVNELAENTDASISSVRFSLRKLTSQGIVRVKGIPNPEAFGFTIMAATLIQVQPSKLSALTEKLQVHPAVNQINLIFGAFNCIIWTSFENANQMYDFLDQDLGNTPGVVHFENMIGLRIQKI